MVGTMVDTQGRTALVGLVSRTTQEAIARLAHATQGQVSRWLAGKVRPDALQREALERSVAIPCDWWLTDAEREELDMLPKMSVGS